MQLNTEQILAYFEGENLQKPTSKLDDPKDPVILKSRLSFLANINNHNKKVNDPSHNDSTIGNNYRDLINKLKLLDGSSYDGIKIEYLEESDVICIGIEKSEDFIVTISSTYILINEVIMQKKFPDLIDKTNLEIIDIILSRHFQHTS